jgi:heterotetrameric sarcosine oxidase gamma subunit
MSDLQPANAFYGLHPAGEGGGVRVRMLEPDAILTILARSGKTNALIDKSHSELGLELADEPKRVTADETAALGIGPGRWLFITNAASKVTTAFDGLASISNHTDGYALFGIAGPKARNTLAKGVPVDLHPAIFDENSVAVTVVSHIGALVWKNTADEFVVAVFRSYAGSFWDWLAESAEEFGLEIC